jgi:hypothetical protein
VCYGGRHVESNVMEQEPAAGPELDQRAREARLRLKRIERQLLPRAFTRFPLRRSFIFAAPAFSSARREKAGLEGR